MVYFLAIGIILTLAGCPDAGSAKKEPAIPEYSVTIDNSIENGTVIADPIKANSGAVITLTVTPEEGYKLKPGTLKYNTSAISKVINEITLKFSMPEEDVTITAEFMLLNEPGPEENDIIIGTFANGTITALPMKAIADTEITLTVTPDPGYVLKPGSLKYNGTAINETEKKFIMPEGVVTISAEFAKLYTVTISGSIENGAVTADPQSAIAGTVITVTVMPDAGYEYVESSLKFNNTVIDDSKPEYGEGNNDIFFTFEMPEDDAELFAEFEENIGVTLRKITIANTVTNGTISADPNADIVPGTEITVTVTPDTDYVLSPGTLGPGSLGFTTVNETTFTFIMPNVNVTLQAVFILDPNKLYQINVGSFADGSISVSPSPAKAGDEITVVVEPDEGYRLKAGTLKYGSTAINETSLKFTMPSEDITISAEFEVLPLSWGVFTAEDFVKTDGNKLRKNNGTGDEIFSYGVNNGGHLLIERYKDDFSAGTTVNHVNVTNTLVTRFGKEKTLELWELYRDNFWTDADFQICVDMGINTIRLPFGYWTIDPEYNNVPEISGKKYNFTILDKFITRAADFGIYIILDLHGAYGSQSGQDHTGEDISNAANVDFYRNETKMSKTLDIWTEVAARYEGHPAIIAYDTLNEPSIKGGAWGNGDNPTGTVNQIHDFLNRCYQTIREVDKDHIVMIETCWEGDKMLTLHNKAASSGWNWTNVWYSFHHYTGQNSAASHKTAWDDRVVSDVPGRAFYQTVPVQMGEYSCYNNQTSWEQSHASMKQYRWNWTMWTYKVSKDVSGWGIVHAYPSSSINVSTDSEAQIRTKFESLKTVRATLNSGGTSRMYFYKFSSGGTDTLYNVLRNICAQY